MPDDVPQSVVADPGSTPASESPSLPAVSLDASVTAGGAQVVGAPEKSRRKSRSDEEVAYWRAAVDEWNALLEAARSAGGLLPSIRGFCRDRKLREPSFYWCKCPTNHTLN